MNIDYIPETMKLSDYDTMKPSFQTHHVLLLLLSL